MDKEKQHTNDKVKPFWEVKDLREMTPEEWESLCDGCGRCCLNKLEFEDTNEIFFTNAACKLLDLDTGKCSNYLERKRFVSDCITLTSGVVRRMKYLPNTCAYRLLAEGKKLKPWHPLVSGYRESVHEARISICDRGVISEEGVEELEDHVTHWVSPIKIK